MNKQALKNMLIALGVAILIYWIYASGSSKLYSIMSISFLFGLPFIVGLLVVYLSDIGKVENISYRIFAPWVPVGCFLLLTLLIGWEGWACLLMASPIFLSAATAGGLTGGYIKLKRFNNGKNYVSILILLPLFLSPVEQMIGAIPGKYEAYTYIDIKAGKDKIWRNVTRVKAIEKQQDKGWFTRTLGFPRPVRAELNYNGVGAYRKAIFDKGLVFHEQVLYYEDQRRMDFSIKAHPYEIPSTTMDKHVVIGGDYFDVLNGTYVLQQTGVNSYRLHLYSHFKLTTTFNFYASWWAGWIMSDIQNNILQVIKQRAEQ